MLVKIQERIAALNEVLTKSFEKVVGLKNAEDIQDAEQGLDYLTKWLERLTKYVQQPQVKKPEWSIIIDDLILAITNVLFSEPALLNLPSAQQFIQTYVLPLQRLKECVTALNGVLTKSFGKVSGLKNAESIQNAEEGLEYLTDWLSRLESFFQQGSLSKAAWRIHFDWLISTVHKVLFFLPGLLPLKNAQAFIQKYPLPLKWKQSFDFMGDALPEFELGTRNGSSRWVLGVEKIKSKTGLAGEKKYHIKSPVPLYLESNDFRNIQPPLERLIILIDAQLEVIGAELFAALTNDPRKTRIAWEVLGETPDDTQPDEYYDRLHPYIATEQVNAKNLIEPNSPYFPDEIVTNNIELFVYLYFTAQDDHSSANFIRDDMKLTAIDFGCSFSSISLTAYLEKRTDKFDPDPLDAWPILSAKKSFSVLADDIERLPGLFVNSEKYTDRNQLEKHFNPRRWATNKGSFNLTEAQNLAKYRACIKAIILISAVIKGIIADPMCPRTITAQALETYSKERVEAIFKECLKIPLFCQIAAAEETYTFIHVELEKFNAIHAKRPERQININKEIDAFREKFRMFNAPIQLQQFSSVTPPSKTTFLTGRVREMSL